MITQVYLLRVLKARSLPVRGLVCTPCKGSWENLLLTIVDCDGFRCLLITLHQCLPLYVFCSCVFFAGLWFHNHLYWFSFVFKGTAFGACSDHGQSVTRLPVLWQGIWDKPHAKKSLLCLMVSVHGPRALVLWSGSGWRTWQKSSVCFRVAKSERGRERETKTEQGKGEEEEEEETVTQVLISPSRAHLQWI